MPAGGDASPLRIRLRCLFTGALLAGFLTPARATSQPSEYAIKAEFIERFTRFIDWPESAFLGRDAPFVLCVIGGNPFGDYLDRLARERKIKDRKVKLLLVGRSSELDPCHLVFVATSESDRAAAIV